VLTTHRRTSTYTTLVRVIAWPAGGGAHATTVVASEFAGNLYPKLREYLPR
jgi:hypothetical protein